MKHSRPYQDILSRLPYGESFLFVDELLEVGQSGVLGTYTYSREADFYRGHFVDRPVTPGVILTETMAQIGLVCLGIYLAKEGGQGAVQFAMTSSEVDYLLPVYPGEKVTVTSETVYYRFGKLKCKVEMENQMGQVVCKGTLSGMTIGDRQGITDSENA